MLFIWKEKKMKNMKKIALAVLVIVLIATFALAKDSIKVVDMQKLNLGDSFEQVSEKVGEPQQILSKELTSDGKEQVIWQYEVVKKPTDWGLIQPADRGMADQQVYQQQRVANPPYLVIFINGKVTKIQRQKIEATPTAQVNVATY